MPRAFESCKKITISTADTSLTLLQSHSTGKLSTAGQPLGILALLVEVPRLYNIDS